MTPPPPASTVLGETLAVRTAGYLIDCQVVAPDLEIGEGTFTTFELGGDTTEARYRAWIGSDGGSPAVWFGRADDADPAAGPFHIGDFLRLFRGRHVHETAETYHVEAESEYTGRLARKYVDLTLRELKRPSPKRLARMSEGLINLLRYFFDRSRRVDRVERFESIIGITWRIDSITEDAVRMSCYDRGGILDFHGNSESHELPPQVMGTVYADAYAAWVLAHLTRRRPDPRTQRASTLAFEFLERVYPGYRASMTPMTHADFKNAGLLETLRSFADDIEAATRAGLVRHAETLREDLYLPTNVYALRVHWKLAQRSYARVNERDISRAMGKVARDLLPDGLIQDNNPGRFYFDSHDLTYHQYTLACLADAIRIEPRTDLIDMFLRGVRFSLNALTPDGEVSYMGRGANNVYHLTSAYRAFRLAATLADDTVFAGQLRRGAELMCAYIAHAQQPSGMLATAVNEYIDERMAWNHCHSPYNALSCYHLLRGLDEPDGAEDSPLPSESPGRFDVHPDSRFAFCTTPHYYATVFAGSERSYSWSAGHHFVGAAGLAMLGVPGTGALIPILDGVVTDVPVMDGDPSGRGRLTHTTVSPPITTVRQRVVRHYVFLPERVVMITFGRGIDHALRAPLRADGRWRHRRLDGDQLSVVGHRGETGGEPGVEWRHLFASARVGDDWHVQRTSNPRGWVDLVTAGHMTADRVSLVHSITPYRRERPTLPPIRTEGDVASVRIGIEDLRIVATPDRVDVR